MRSALRKMGNSTGIIVPVAVLRDAGLATGTLLDISVENGRIIATPVIPAIRAGWAEDAALIGQAPVPAAEAEWLDTPNEGDAALTW